MMEHQPMGGDAFLGRTLESALPTALQLDILVYLPPIAPDTVVPHQAGVLSLEMLSEKLDVDRQLGVVTPRTYQCVSLRGMLQIAVQGEVLALHAALRTG